MSFPRAQLKRFNDNQGVGPAPGAYDVKDSKPSSGILPFEKGSERFKQGDASHEIVKEHSSTLPAPRMPAPASKKQLNFTALNPNESKCGKTTPRPSPIANKGKEASEKEIRRLLQQLNEQDKKLSHKLEDIRKLESRINQLLKEKSSLVGQVAAAERKVTELDKRNALLESQKLMQKEKQLLKEDLENELKKTKAKHETAKQELDKSKAMLVAMQSDLDGARSTISALQKSNSALTQHNKEAQQHNDEVGIQMSKLQDIVDDLRSDKVTAEQQLSIFKVRFETVEKEFTNILHEKAEEIRKELETKQQAMKVDLENLKNDAADSYSKVEELRNRLNVTELERDEVMSKKDELQEKLECVIEEKQVLQESFKQKEAELNGYKSNTVEDEKVRDTLNEKVSQLTESIKRLKIDSREVEHALRKELLSVQENNKVKEEQFNDIIQKLKTSDSDLKSQIESLCKELEEKKDEATNLDNERDLLSQELVTLKSTFEEERKSKMLINQKVEAQSKELEELYQMKAEWKHECSQHAEETSELKDQILELEAKADALETQLMRSSANVSRVRNDEEQANKKIEQLEIQLSDHKAQYQAKLDEFTRRLLDTQKKLNLKQEELQNVIALKDSETAELKKMKKLTDEQSATLLDNERLVKECTASKEKVIALQNEMEVLKSGKADDALLEELNKWKDLYNELQYKVRPFQSQIDAYCAERQSLLCENSMAHAEMQALGKKYAELLGHQNHKQKIKHIVKIKEENNKLKQEVAKLRSQVEKNRKDALARRPKRFDPNEAFQQKKENTPLCDNS